MWACKFAFRQKNKSIMFQGAASCWRTAFKYSDYIRKFPFTTFNIHISQVLSPTEQSLQKFQGKENHSDRSGNTFIQYFWISNW